MPEQTSKLAPTEPENIYLYDELDRQRLENVPEDEIAQRVNSIVEANKAFDASIVPHVDGDIDLSNIVDTSGTGEAVESDPSKAKEIGSIATGAEVSKVALPPPSLN